MSAITELKSYFDGLYKSDRAKFEERSSGFEAILAAIAKGNGAEAFHLIEQAIKQYKSDFGDSRYAVLLNNLWREIKQNQLGIEQDILRNLEKQELREIVERIQGLLKELDHYINHTRQAIKKETSKLLGNDESLESVTEFAKKKISQHATLALFGSASIGGINVLLSEDKIKIAKDLSNELRELILLFKSLNPEELAALKPSNMAYSAALHLKIATEQQKIVLGKYNVGSEGELGKIMKSATEFLQCYCPSAVRKVQQDYDELLRDHLAPGK